MLLIKLRPLALLESVFRQIKNFIRLFYFVLFFIPPNPPLQPCVECSGEAMWRYVSVFGNLRIIKQPTRAGKGAISDAAGQADTGD